MTNLWDYDFAAQEYYPSEWPALWDGVLPGEVSLASLPVAGVEGDGLYVPTASTEVGALAPMFFADFYNRIHITPQSITLGNVIGTQEVDVTVWNAHLLDRRLDDLTILDGEGITIDGQPPTPFFFGPTTELTWTVTIGTAGPPIIEASLEFDFDREELYLVPITGNRVTAWSWTVDWGGGITERLEWATDVIPNYDGSEQRRKLRLNPRRSLEFRFTAIESDRRILESVAWGWGSRVFAVPLWQDGSDLQALLPVDSTTIPVDTATRDYQVGGVLILLGDTSRDWEVCEIEAVDASSVTLTRPTSRDWAAGSRVFPAKAGRLNGPFSLSRFTGDVSSGRVLFDFTEPHIWPADAGDETYRDHPVLTTLANWVRDPEFTLERKLARYDNMTGLQYFDDESNRPASRQTLDFTLTDREDADAWRKLLHALAGRFTAIWIRTGTLDIELAAPILEAEAAADIHWIGYTLFVGVVPGKKDIRIELADGTVLYRRITNSVELDADTERLTLDAAPGIDIQPSDVVSISFLSLCRLDSDAVELAHWTGDVCETALPFKGFGTDA